MTKVLALLFLCLVLFSPGRMTDVDAENRRVLAAQLWEKGTVFLDSTPQIPEGILTAPNGKKTTVWGIGQSLALVPFDFLGEAIASRFAHTPWTAYHYRTLPLVFLYAPLVGVLWFLALFKLLELFGFEKPRSLPLSLLFFFSSVMFYYSAQTLQEEALIGMCLTWAAVFLIRSLNEENSGLSILSGILCGFALLCRFSDALSLLPILGMGLDFGRGKKLLPKTAKFFFLGFLPIFALHFVFAKIRFGGFLSTGYPLLYAEIGVRTWAPFSWKTLSLILFGLSKSVFLFSPLLLLAFFNRSFQITYPLYSILSLIGFLVPYFLYAGTFDPDGSESWGVRYGVHQISLFAPLALGLLKTKTPRPTYALLSLGILIEVLSVWAPHALEYGQRSLVHEKEAALLYRENIGQLGMRAKNVFELLTQGRMAFIESLPRKDLKGIAEFYMPNVWWYSYPKKLSASYSH